MTCYGARIVAGLAADPRGARRGARSCPHPRAENPEYDEMFVDFHRLLPRLPGSVTGQVAAARD